MIGRFRRRVILVISITDVKLQTQIDGLAHALFHEACLLLGLFVKVLPIIRDEPEALVVEGPNLALLVNGEHFAVSGVDASKVLFFSKSKLQIH